MKSRFRNVEIWQLHIWLVIRLLIKASDPSLGYSSFPTRANVGYRTFQS